MRIAGVNEFFSRSFTWPNQNAANNAVNPFLPGKRADIIDISEIGKRLSFRSDNVSLLDRNRAAGAKDPILQLMDKSMSEVESVLEQMKELAEAALNPNLDITDRLNMQIQMEELRNRLGEATNAMSNRLARMSGQDIDIGKLQVRSAFPNGNHPDDERAMLERARDRALRGEAWDVAEGPEILQELRGLRTSDHDIKIRRGEWFELPSDIDAFDPASKVRFGQPRPAEFPDIASDITQIMGFAKTVRGDEVYTFFRVHDGQIPDHIRPGSGQIFAFAEIMGFGFHVLSETERLEMNISTVSEILKASGTILLTDARSAAEGTERIQTQLDEMKQMRRQFNEFSRNENQSPSFTRRTGRMSDGEIYALIGQIQQEEEARRRALNGTADEEDEAPGAAPKIQIHTQIGVMEAIPDKGFRLVRPEGAKGEMFSKLERLFDRIGTNFGFGGNTTPVNKFLMARKHTWTNTDPSSWLMQKAS